EQRFPKPLAGCSSHPRGTGRRSLAAELPDHHSGSRMTRTGAAARPAALQERSETLLAWAELHSRLLTGIAIAILVLIGGVWFYQKAHQARARNASVLLTEAEQARAAGNLPLAQSNLERVVSRYGGTPAGHAARLVLAQVLYDKGQYQQGITELQKLIDDGDEALQASAYNLMG